MNTIAYSLYSENPNLIWHHEHSSVMVANVVYGGHLVAGILVLFGMYAIVYSQVRVLDVRHTSEGKLEK